MVGSYFVVLVEVPFKADQTFDPATPKLFYSVIAEAQHNNVGSIDTALSPCALPVVST